MRVEQLGTGTPSIAIVGGIHGDEPCGVTAIERLISEAPPVTEPVKLVVANELAIERGVRYVDEDLNRAFPGDPDAGTHEGQLASRLSTELADTIVFSMHSTRSHAEPFAVVDGLTGTARRLCSQLSIGALVETGPLAEGRLFTGAETIEVECGLQGTETAAENAARLVHEFLTATGALPGTTIQHRVPVYRLIDTISKNAADRYEVFVDNFERVESGAQFAAADGEARVAEEPFYPVLLSADGYEDVFGYSAKKLTDLVPAQGP
ncbi:succinylglutamate desuccinylase/aspartoacylase domain-containing protein [Halovivax cerinus]|uniref:Succinylglutamate desuccinylase/aspartoacylase family protein n=1 Tax=Halovivax cerinus TaxID=1487865 RepID=A0ABD5NSK3_9EURY|nr:succinylglutamate desuccinylase/aspartoacylase family protein [Halovivax cerinus]